MFRQIGRRWSGMSSGFHLGRLFIVLLLLLFFSLFWFHPAGFYSLLPDFNVADVPGLSSVHSFMSSQSQSAEGIVEVLVQSPPPSAEMPPQEVSSAAPPAVVVLDSERLVQMEQSLRALWEEMEAAERRAEQSHSELLQLYADLHQQASGSHHSRYDVELWTRGLMEQQLSLLRRRLGEERRQREQMRQQDLLVVKTQMSRLEQLELQLQQVVARSRVSLKIQLVNGFKFVYGRGVKLRFRRAGVPQCLDVTLVQHLGQMAESPPQHVSKFHSILLMNTDPRGLEFDTCG
ncbi:hypothetical protein XENORESO_013244 [Xenotaenia resolanae]|uniref:Uncharacterized protein n=1 Tax=Xenotaenia resolanae TaxID=208358 RepID=A0ABV0W5R2_9TELE